MTGQELYELFRELHAVALDKWDDLSEADREAWDALSIDVYTERVGGAEKGGLVNVRALKVREEMMVGRKSTIADGYRSEAGVTLVVLDFEPVEIPGDSEGRRVYERRFVLSTPGGNMGGIVETKFDTGGKRK